MSHLDDLREGLGAEPPPAIAALDPADLETLHRALATSRNDQRQALERAIDDGLGFVPRLLRGAIKKVLFG